MDIKKIWLDDEDDGSIRSEKYYIQCYSKEDGEEIMFLFY